MGLSRHSPISSGMRNAATAVTLALALLATACFGGGDDEADVSASKITRTLTGTPWVPNVTGAGASNHDSGVTVTKTSTSTSGLLTGLSQAWTGREIKVTIDMTQDLGQYGSITLEAKTTGFPSGLLGGAYPLLTYLSDGTNELVNLTRSGAGNCADSGVYNCSTNPCTNNTSCKAEWPSAYFDRTHWLQHQLHTSFTSYVSVNTFPSCNWTGSTDPSSGSPYEEPECAFNSNFFVSGKLRSGVSYTAKYVLMADRYASFPSPYTAGLTVSVIKKSKAVNTNPGALDLNLIFVGYDVAQASRNAKGKINLDRMMSGVQKYLNVSSVNVKLGTITAYEWTAGDAYAEAKTSDFAKMVAAGSAAVGSASEGKSVNVFFLKNIAGSSSLLGQAGAIGGPSAHGLANSGVVVSTFGLLDQFNANCSASPCLDTQIDEDFATLEQTVVHEIGHYLGLNHVSESTGTAHDLVHDTPMCTTVNPSYGVLTIGSCLNLDGNIYPSTSKTCLQNCGSYNAGNNVYCATAPECQFNYMMYWSSKFFSEGLGTGDGSLFSSGQGTIINYCPLIQ
jgi:hypothetical protein